MSLHIGDRIGPYEIVAAIGAGGMGEVYRATDSRLKRSVAIKVLPDALSHDSDRLDRFKREAELLAALNHPNIAAVYGLEEKDGLSAIVMELIEGPTLAEIIQAKALGVSEALPIARQIADALEAAHEKGVIHRDLKPANVKVTADGHVKVLDFGLAKMLETETAASPPLTMSPTMTARGTQVGILLGTAAYMSPEQARGRPVDKRTDIWAFGCVLLEMMSGKTAFAGEEVSDTLALIIAKDPDWASLPADLPASITKLLRRCLTKDRKHRLADIADARFEIEEVLNAAAPGVAATPSAQREWLGAKTRWFLLAASLVVVASAATGILVWRVMRPPAPRLSRFTIQTSGATTLTINGVDRDLTITPDGSRVVYGDANNQIFVRAMDQLEPTKLGGGSVIGRGRFVDPSGQWVGFFTLDVMIKKIPISGGPVLSVCQTDGASRGATWGPDGTIIYATAAINTGLQRVPAAGGTPTSLTKPDREHGEADHLWPEFLPGGRAVLFTITPLDSGMENSQIAVLDLQTNKTKILVPGGSDAHYVSTGHLVYAAAGGLRAIGFDLDRLAVVGTATPVPLQVVTTPSGLADLAVARDGTLVYVPGPGVEAAARTLVWVDRQGREDPIKAEPRAYVYPRLSPDGTRVALDIRDRQNDIWILDLSHGSLRPLTADAGLDSFPVWTPDGHRIVFSSERNGARRNIFWQAADGTGVVDQLTQSPTGQFPSAAYGAQLIFSEPQRQQIATLSLENDHRARPILTSSANEGAIRNAEISPDGHWVAYESNDSREFQVSVRPFPDTNSGRYPVSTAGGTRPVWSRSLTGNQELFYLANDGALMSVTVERSTTWRAGNPVKVIDRPYFRTTALFGRTYDVSLDGKRFLMIKSTGGDESNASPTSFVVVQNWTEELKRLVPVK